MVRKVWYAVISDSGWVLGGQAPPGSNVTFTGATVEGAYDNGSGANLLRFFARALAKVDTRRSIAIVWPGLPTA